jgi:hypothetical protein
MVVCGNEHVEQALVRWKFPDLEITIAEPTT